MAEYKDKNKSSGEDGYSNRRGADAIANFFGGLSGGARDKMRQRQEKIKQKQREIDKRTGK